MEEKETYLAKTSYRDYLLKNVGLSETSVKYFQGRSNDFSALGADALPAADARRRLPGFDALGLPQPSEEAQAEMDEPYIYHFPDGNASLARLMVRDLIPRWRRAEAWRTSSWPASTTRSWTSPGTRCACA